MEREVSVQSRAGGVTLSLRIAVFIEGTRPSEVGGGVLKSRSHTALLRPSPRKELEEMATFLGILFFGIVTALPVGVLFYFLMRDSGKK